MYFIFDIHQVLTKQIEISDVIITIYTHRV